MARTNATLEAAQKGYSVDAVEEVYYWNYTGRPSDGGDHWARIDNLSSKARIVDDKESTYIWEPKNLEATIYLNNADSAFDAYDLEGKWVKIGLGIGSEISYPPYLKVQAQDFSSTKGKPRDTYVLHCHGAWNILLNYIVPASLFFNQPDLEPSLDGYAGDDILNKILEDAGLDLGASISTDGLITTKQPKIDIYAGTSGLEAVQAVLAPFQCALLPRNDNMHILSGTTGDSYTYELDENITYHPFLSGVTRSVLYKPMKCVVNSYDGTYTGSYAATGWVEEMGHFVWDDKYQIASSNADCAHIAQAIVERAQSNKESGMIYVPIMNCLQELYDQITIVDGRGNISGSGVAGGIYWKYRPGNKERKIKKLFSMELRLGGLQRSMPSDPQGFVDLMNANMSGISGQKIFPHSLPVWAFRNSMQGYSHDIVADAADAGYTWENVKSDGGTIEFKESGATQTIDAFEYNLTTLGYGDNIVMLYFIEGDSIMHHTDDPTVATGADRDIIAFVQRAETSEATDKVSWYGHDGKVDVLNARALIADMILAKHIRAGAIETDHLAANAVTAAKIDAGAVDTDQLAAGAVEANKINVSTLSAITANLGTITAGAISGVTLSLSGSCVTFTDDAIMENPTHVLSVTAGGNLILGSSNANVIIGGYTSIQLVTTAGNITINAGGAGDIVLTATGDEVQINSATLDINLTGAYTLNCTTITVVGTTYSYTGADVTFDLTGDFFVDCTGSTSRDIFLQAGGKVQLQTNNSAIQLSGLPTSAPGTAGYLYTYNDGSRKYVCIV